MADASPGKRLTRVLAFLWGAFLKGFGSLNVAYKGWVAAVAIALVVLGISVPPIFKLIPLRYTLPIGIAVVALVVVVGAYRMWDETDRRLETESQQRALPTAVTLERLQARYEQSEPYRHPEGDEPWAIVEHRIGVFNPQGNQAARRVRVHLVSLEPRPRNVANAWPPVIPCVVPPLAGGDGVVGVTVAAGREELWRIGYTATGSDRSMNAGGFAVSDQRWRGLPWQINPDERLRLGYEIVCERNRIVEFSIVLYPDGGRLRCKLEG